MKLKPGAFGFMAEAPPWRCGRQETLSERRENVRMFRFCVVLGVEL